MQNKSKPAQGGIGLLGAVFLVFLVLKLCGVITWSWWWITAPLWGGAALAIVVFVAGIVFYVAFLLIVKAATRHSG